MLEVSKSGKENPARKSFFLPYRDDAFKSGEFHRWLYSSSILVTVKAS